MKFLVLLLLISTMLFADQIVFSFSDGTDGGSSGNEDGIINNFESVLIKGFTLLEKKKYLSSNIF